MSTNMKTGTVVVAKQSTTTTITTKDNGTSIILSNDIDDFVTPSMACINPIFSSSSVVSTSVNNNNTNNNNSNDTTTNKVIPRKRRVVINNSTTRQRSAGAVVSQRIPESLDSKIVVPVVTNDTNANTATGSNKTDTDSFANTSLTVKNPGYSPSSDPNSSKNVDNNTNNTNTNKLSDIVKASLADCLACSGCITTAETVLLEEQHSLDLLRVRYKNTTTIATSTDNNNSTNDIGIVTISPASYADICRHLSFQQQHLQQNSTCNSIKNSSTTTVQCKITTLLYEMWNIILVIDGNVPLLCSLHESAIDFCTNYKQHRQQVQQQQEEHCDNKYNTNSYPSVALSSTRMNVLLPDGTIETIDNDNANKKNGNNKNKSNNIELPIISSSCPATVCLIEKSIPTAVSHIHTIRSPMSIAGSVIMQNQQQNQQQQYFLNTDLTTTVVTSTTTVTATTASSSIKQSIFHIAIMPCHDKKLEASRKDFYNDSTKQNDISIVITTAEFLLLMEEYIVYVQSQQEQQQENCSLNTDNATQVVHDYIYSRQESKCVVLSSVDEFVSSTSSLWNTIQTTTEETTIFVPTFITIPTQQHQTKLDEPNTMNTNTNTNTIVEQDQTKVTTNNSILSSFFPYGSGGYADYIFRYAAYNLFGYTISSDTIVWTTTTSIASYYATNNNASTSTTNNSTNKSSTTKRVSVRVARQRQKDFYTATLYQITNNDTGLISYSTTIKSIDNSNSTITTNTTIEPVLQFAIAYGMPTLQQVLNPFHQQTTTTTTTTNKSSNHDIYKSIPNLYHYVEAMACPSGCINGGGQIRSTTTSTTSSSSTDKNTTADTTQQSIQQSIQQQQQRETPTQTRERIERTEQWYQYPATTTSTTRDMKPMTNIIAHSEDDEEKERNLVLRTRFHIVPKMQYNTGAVAGVSVSDTQW